MNVVALLSPFYVTSQSYLDRIRCARHRWLMPIETIKTILTLVSGLCWTLVYIEGIRLGIRDRSYAIPFYALALNLAWELLHAYLGLRATIGLQAIINAVWFLFDVGILYTYFRYGKKYFPASLASMFVPWSILGLFTAFWIQHAFVRDTTGN